MKDDIAKRIIRYRKNELRKLTLSLGNVKWTIVAFAIMIACFGISYVCRDTWLSNVLISIGAGFVTGLVFYWLSNLRNNKISQIQEDIEILEPILKEFRNIENWALMSKYPSWVKLSNLTIDDMAYRTMENIEYLVELTNTIKFDLAQELEMDTDYTFEQDSVREYRSNFEKAQANGNFRRWIVDVNDKLSVLRNKLDDLLKTKKELLRILQHKVF